ncbi:LytR C-terminal domain-containing protein [Microbacterium sp. cf332]|uniref:LytR C-terminal domain-containing protein n=1 Tax=Microbacterium sp. cf332 TaxID=1761804 RepID=UPI00087F7A90|nr:LytR C-terminal domain-containing protein [Microbacterium sp. cf332]SDQ87901.1 LytR cell envelope-related transcriptional attenuator [Microbacterium sp. cf332]
MPTTTYPKDRFDELPADSVRVGAHRAENPRLRPAVLLFWAAAAVLVLVAVGIFGTLLVTGRIALFPTSQSSAPAAETTVDAEPVIDTSYPVLILNATTERGLANSVRDTVVGAGWSSDVVDAGEAGTQDFATTTIYYLTADDEGAARGLAEVVGGAAIEMSDAYPGPTNEDGTPGKQLTIVLGADRLQGGDGGE